MLQEEISRVNVGQLGKLRAGCLPALGRIAGKPQEGNLPRSDSWSDEYLEEFTATFGPN